MSEVSTTMAMTTTPLVTVLSSGMSSLSLVTMAPSLMRLPTTMSQCDVVLLPPLTPKVPWRCYWSCLCAIAATSIFNTSSGLCQLCHEFSTGTFHFQSWASNCYVYYMFVACFVVCFLLSGAILDAIFTPGASTIGVCTISTLWSLPVSGICATW